MALGRNEKHLSSIFSDSATWRARRMVLMVDQDRRREVDYHEVRKHPKIFICRRGRHFQDRCMIPPGIRDPASQASILSGRSISGSLTGTDTWSISVALGIGLDGDLVRSICIPGVKLPSRGMLPLLNRRISFGRYHHALHIDIHAMIQSISPSLNS